MRVRCRNPGLVRVGSVRHVAGRRVVRRAPASSAAAVAGDAAARTPAPGGDDDGARRSHGASPGHVRAAGDAGRRRCAALRRRLDGTCTGHTRPIMNVSAAR